MRKRVYCFIPSTSAYPYEAFSLGIKNCGWGLSGSTSDWVDCIITWNCYGAREDAVRKIKSQNPKAVHLVAENGYLRRDLGYVVLEVGGFNGNAASSPHFLFDRKERFRSLQVRLESSRRNPRSDAPIAVIGQRGGSYSAMAMANDWPDSILSELRALTNSPLVYIPHWGRARFPRNLPRSAEVADYSRLDEVLEVARSLVVWTSSVSNKAIARGIPCFYCGPTIKMASCCRKGVKEINDPFFPSRGQRLLEYYKLAASQFTVGEIAEGWPIRQLVENAERQLG